MRALPPVRSSRPVRVASLAAVSASLLFATVSVNEASAHGSTIDPPSRNYGCWERWGDDFQSPAMATEDPMCDQAWKADPNAMWNWNGTYRDGVGGNHQAAVPDGQLCSAGQTGGTRYAALDNPGPWKAKQVGTDFTVTVHDQARHGGDYYRIYVTKQGFDPLTERLGWDDLELVEETGKIAPGEGRSAEGRTQGGTLVDIPVSAPGRSGRHIVYTVWQASHSDQSYYLCSDVVFGGGGGQTPQPPATPPTTAPTPPTTAPPTTTTSTTVAPQPEPQPEPTPPTTVAPQPAPTPEPGGSGFTSFRDWLRQLFASWSSARSTRG